MENKPKAHLICKLILGSSLNGSLMSTLGEFSVNKFLLTPLDVHLLHSVEAELLKTTFRFLPSNSPSLYVDFLFADNKWEQIPPNQLRKYDVFFSDRPDLARRAVPHRRSQQLHQPFHLRRLLPNRCKCHDCG